MDHVCPICLQKQNNQAILDCCKHTFCKNCIMAWMKTTKACPLCKRSIGVIIADILTPSEYSQFLPDGKYLYSSFSPRRKVIYSLGLEPFPNYEGKINPHSASKCSYLNEWIQREIETLLPGADTYFIVTLILEGINRYGSRSDYVYKKVVDLLDQYTTIFIREFEGCVNCKAKCLEEYDALVTYCYPSLAEQQGELTPSVDCTRDDVYREHYNHLRREYEDVDEELNQLLIDFPSLNRLADIEEKRLQQCEWKQIEYHVQESKPTIQSEHIIADESDIYQFSEQRNDYCMCLLNHSLFGRLKNIGCGD